MSDPETLRVYNARAKDYAQAFETDETDKTLARFVAALPEGGRVLDLGCGPGRAAGLMAREGLVVDAIDASAAMVELARERPGVTAWQASFDDLDAEALYDGIWANFCLLHAPREDIPRHLNDIRRALKAGGILHVGVKEGTGMARDALGRRYTYFTVDEMKGLLRDAGLDPGPVTRGASPGLDGTVSAWFTLTAHG